MRCDKLRQCIKERLCVAARQVVPPARCQSANGLSRQIPVVWAVPRLVSLCVTVCAAAVASGSDQPSREDLALQIREVEHLIAEQTGASTHGE